MNLKTLIGDKITNPNVLMFDKAAMTGHLAAKEAGDGPLVGKTKTDCFVLDNNAQLPQSPTDLFEDRLRLREFTNGGFLAEVADMAAVAVRDPAPVVTITQEPPAVVTLRDDAAMGFTVVVTPEVGQMVALYYRTAQIAAQGNVLFVAIDMVVLAAVEYVPTLNGFVAESTAGNDVFLVAIGVIGMAVRLDIPAAVYCPAAVGAPEGLGRGQSSKHCRC